MRRSRGTGSMRAIAPLGLWIAILGFLPTATAIGMIETGAGNKPVDDRGWPAGSVDLANLKTRVGWWAGPPFGTGSEYCFMYRGSGDDLQRVVDGLAKIRAPKVVLVIHDNGPAESPFLGDEHDSNANARYDWSFTVWNAQDWNQLYNNPLVSFNAGEPEEFRETVASPTLDVYENRERGIDISKMKVPAAVSVIDQRAVANGFASGSAMVGEVYDMTTSKPMAGAKVVLAREKGEDQWEQVGETKTDVDGHFEMRSAEKGYLGIIGSAQGYASRVLGRPELRGNTFIRFSSCLAPAATMKGIVVDTDGKPIAGASVRADSVTGLDGRGYAPPVHGEGVTDAKGGFEITGLPRGFAQLFASGNNLFQLDMLKLHTIPGEDQTIRLTATGEIKGRVIDHSGNPANKGNVDIEPDVPERDRIGRWSGSSDTAADGSFHFEDVPPGRYIVTAAATNPGPALIGKNPNAKTIDVKAGQTITLEVTGR
jgi:hypothetical protein